MPKSFVFPLRVYIEDTDCGGIVYHSNYLNFMERARTEWLDSLKLGIDYWADRNVVFIIRHAELSYLAPAKMNARLDVHTEIEQIRASSITFKHRVTPEGQPDKVLCEGTVHVVTVNKAIQPVRVPDELREAVAC